MSADRWVQLLDSLENILSESSLWQASLSALAGQTTEALPPDQMALLQSRLDALQKSTEQLCQHLSAVQQTLHKLQQRMPQNHALLPPSPNLPEMERRLIRETGVDFSRNARRDPAPVEQALRINAEKLHQITTYSPVYIYELNADGIITFANRTYDGLSQERVVGTHITDWFPAEQRSLIASALAQVIQSELPQTVEYAIPNPEGEMRCYSTQMAPVLIDHHVTSVILIANDVTERRQTEAALRESEARYATLAATMPVGVFRTDVEGRCLYCNEHWCEMVGMSGQAALGHGWQHVLHPTDRDRFLMAWNTLLGSSNTLQLEVHYRHTNGTSVWADLRVVPETDSTGQVTGYIGAVNDITQRKLAIEALARSERRLSLALEGAKAGIWEWDMATNQTYWSDENYRLLGYEPGKCASTYDNWLNAVHPEDRDRTQDYVNDVIATNSDLNLEYRVLLPDGSIRWLADSGRLLFNEQGEPSGMSGIQVDITERKQAEEQLRASLKEKEVLLAEIHHRVKNNLQIISSLLNLQANRIDDPQVYAVLEETWNRVDCMALVHESLYHSNNFAEINLAEYVETLAVNLLHTYAVDPEHAFLEVEANPTVYVDLNTAIPCGLILNELITNALKHGLKQGQTRKIFVYLQQSGDRTVTLAIGNCGDTLPVDFDLNQSRSMGLRLVTNLTEQLEGKLEIKRGDPTIFQVSFASPKP